MKKVFSLLLILTVLLSIPYISYANTEKTNVTLNEHQKTFLKGFGLTDDEIKNITYERIRDILTNGIIKDGSILNIPNVSNASGVLTDELKTKLKVKGLTEPNIDALHKKGYTFNEMLIMDIDKIKDLLDDTQILFGEEYSTNGNQERTVCPICGGGHHVPPNMGYVAVVDGGDGGYDEYFHQNVYIPNVNAYDCPMAEAIASYMFYNGGIRATYNLWGEWGECSNPTYIHEGVDIKCTTDSTSAVRALSPGLVVYIDREDKFLNVYDSNLGITVNYQHLSDIPEDFTAYSTTISKGDLIGYQNTTDNHIHFQTCNHYQCTSVHTCYGDTLTCIRPYYYLYYYL